MGCVFEEDIEIYDKMLVIPHYCDLNTAGYLDICQKLNETIEALWQFIPHIYSREYYSTIPNHNNWCQYMIQLIASYTVNIVRIS